VLVLFVAGGLTAILQPWKGTLGPIEAARLLRDRLRTPDQFDCHEPSGLTEEGQPDWTYICVDLSRPQREGYFVMVRGKRITEIQPAG
jgi:hypothetical protein